MSKVTINNIAGGYDLSQINTAFQEIEDQLNNKVLYRDNLVGEPNAMQNDLDMNGNDLLNINDLSVNGTFTLHGKELPTSIETALAEMGAGVLQAEAAATQAAESAAAAADKVEATALASSFGASLVGYIGGTVSSAMDSIFSFIGLSRTRLTSDLTYYVRNDGSDDNNGLSNNAIGAFLTIQKAIDTISEKLDLNGHSVTVQCADGTRTAGFSILGPWVGRGNVYVIGNIANPAGCPINANSVGVFYAENNASVYVDGFKITNAGGDGVYAQVGANITVGAMEYGAVLNSHVTVGGGGFIHLTKDYKITGGGASHLHAGSPGLILGDTITSTITGSPAFSAYFAGAAEGTIAIRGITFTGSATGATHLVHKGGVIETHPAFASLPGSIPGRQATGGSLIGSQITPFKIAPDTPVNNSVRLQSYNISTALFTDRFVVDSQPTGSGGGKGWAYVNGDDSFMSGRTHLGCAAIVDATTANDGLTVAPGFAAYCSQTSLASLNLRRQGTDGAIINFYKGGVSPAQVGSITVTASATAFNTSSDYRLKNHIGPIKGAWDRVKAIKTADFTFKCDETNTVVHGFIAHELAETHATAVTGLKDDTRTITVMVDGQPVEKVIPHYQGIDPSKIIADLTAALQEAMTRIEMLEQKSTTT